MEGFHIVELAGEETTVVKENPKNLTCVQIGLNFWFSKVVNFCYVEC